MYEIKKSEKMALKPNKLIMAGQQMLPYQQRLFWASLSVLEFTVYNDAHYGKLNDNINNFIEQIRLARTTFKFPASKVFEDYESLKLSNNSEFKKDIEKKTSDIVRQNLLIKDEKTTTAINIMDYAKFDYEEQMIYVQFSKAVIPILFEMFEKGFTKIHLISFLRLKSGYSMRLYEILMSVKNISKNGYTISLKDIYSLFGIDKNKEYKEYRDFKSMILLRIQKEIKEKTGLSFEFEEIKKERKVDLIKFKNIFEDSNFNKSTKQISMFENEEMTEKEIILSTKPNETFLLDVLDNPETYIAPKKKINPEDLQKILSSFNEHDRQVILSLLETDDVQEILPLLEKKPEPIILFEDGEKQKFTEEQSKKLDKYLEGIFSADDIKSKYEFDYIKFYYYKVKEKNDKGTVRDFAGFLYKALTEDKYKYYEQKEKKKCQEEEKISKEKLELERKRKRQQEEKESQENQNREEKRFVKMFDDLSDKDKKIYLEKLYSKNDFYKTADINGISHFTKYAIGKMIDEEQADKKNNI